MTRWLPLVLLAGCASAPEIVVKTVEIKVPVPVRVEAPAELLAPYRPTKLPVFVQPAAPAASSALTADGEKALRAIIEDLTARDAAWRAWAQ